MVMQIKIETEYGEYTAGFEGDVESGYTAWLFEVPLIVEGETIHTCIEEIHKSLDFIVDYEISELLK